MKPSPTSTKSGQKPRRARGFVAASGLIGTQLRKAGESRGFAVSRLLTQWEEIVGEDVAATARPVKVSYARQGLGATLTVLTTGANAPMLEMQKERLRERVNACYGYSAISAIRITQTAPSGFAEGRAVFRGPERQAKAPDPEIQRKADNMANDVQSDDLRQALEALGRNVLTRQKTTGK